MINLSVAWLVKVSRNILLRVLRIKIDTKVVLIPLARHSRWQLNFGVEVLGQLRAELVQLLRAARLVLDGVHQSHSLDVAMAQVDARPHALPYFVRVVMVVPPLLVMSDVVVLSGRLVSGVEILAHLGRVRALNAPTLE